MDPIISQYSKSVGMKYYEKGNDARLVITNCPALGSLEDIADYGLMSSDLVMDVHPGELNRDIMGLTASNHTQGKITTNGRSYHALIIGTKEEVMAAYDAILKKTYDLKNSRPQVGCIVTHDDLYDTIVDEEIRDEE